MRVLVGEREVEPFRVEVSATPALGLGVLRVLRVGHDAKELLVAAHASHIFGRPGPGAIEAGGQFRRNLESEQPLDLDAVKPTVAEVVEIAEPGARLAVYAAAAKSANGAAP